MYQCVIVEDEVLILRNLAKKITLCSSDFNVACEARNGKDALSYIEHHPVDLVLTDIQMPIMTGLELAKTLSEKYPDIIVIIISGYDDFQFAQKAIRYHVSDYLLKPVSAETLRETLNGIQVKLQARTFHSPIVSNTDTRNDSIPSTDSLVDSIRQYIQAHYTEELQISEIAAHFHFTPSYIGNVFKKQTGMTPLQYVTYLRINEAKLLILEHPELSLSQIGKMVGYPDPYYFSRIFKKQTGISPSSYHMTSWEDPE